MIIQATGGGAASSGSGGGGGVFVNAVAATELPEVVEHGQIVVITDVTPANIFFGHDEPYGPLPGDVWIHTMNTGSYDFYIGNVTLTPGVTVQYDGAAWVCRDAYIGRFSTWKLFSTNTSLDALSWAQVMALSDSGADCSKFFNVGDTKNLTLTTGETLTMAIGGFNLNTITGTEKTASIAWTMPHCLATTYAMNSTATNATSWGNSFMCTNFLAGIFAALPEEIKRAVKYVDVVTSAGGESKELVTTSDRLRLHSVTELGLTSTYAAIEGVVYPYYAEGNRIKTVNGVAAKHWTRTPNMNAATYYYISATGTVSSTSANTFTFGVSFCFDT